ncbi:hypothetical protein [Thalassospira sp. TSL5-1]|uniref:hypothetical protein n=1 Tax=Thalassospira sp. TSL5-1 TaxID=1544451 RepID=UPI0009396321|nr:hypothetical protein [Thalassospira sp. TSL5-1]OKH89067.1 hypothetical protein LF95_03145 [Thalassospira sp. TSL5-1]
MPELSATFKDNRLISGHYGAITLGPWGFEASDRRSFLTLDDNSRHIRQSGQDYHFANGCWRLDYQTRLDAAAKTIHIRARFTALTDSPLQDAVIRLVFDKSAIDHGIIAGKTFTHKNSDKYRLRPVRKVQLQAAENRITVTLDHADGAGRFAPFMYLRDRDDHWIIHARLLPTAPIDDIWLRWANRFFTLSCPHALARGIWHIPGGKALFWRLREKWGRHAPEIQAVPLNIVPAGQSLMLEVTCHFH